MELIFELEFEEKSELGKNPDQDLSLLLDVAKEKLEDYDETVLREAFKFCFESHKDSIRKSGAPYYTHPVNVALILMQEFPTYDLKSVVTCLLHDTIEDVKEIEHTTINQEFGNEVAEMVSSVTKISHGQTSKDNKASTYRKLFLALVQDVRIILVKLADRLHNMRTLHYMKHEKQKLIALETLNFYTPLAHRLGLNRIKMELENRSFYFSDRNAYEAIRNELNIKRRDFMNYIKVFSDLIQNSLNEHNIKHTLTVVHKHEYEIYEIMQDGKSIGDIDNFYSMVIILDTDDITECYRAHGVLANAFNAVSFVDYIVNPKMDWYQSLNCEMYGPDGKRVELLIRTLEMEKIAEEGFASAFSLRDGRNRALAFDEGELELWGTWMQSMIEEKGDASSQIIWNSIKVNLFDSELVVYSKQGEPVQLPKGASIIDYAFAISSDHGMHLISAKVNGVFKDLHYTLQTGDQVEIITSPNTFPKMEWQKHIITHRAVVQLYFHFKRLPPEQGKEAEPDIEFDVKLRIMGEDREGMLNDISNAIGLTHIKRINLDTSGAHFEGALIINVHNKKQLNDIFKKLMLIDGISSVKRMELES